MDCSPNNKQFSDRNEASPNIWSYNFDKGIVDVAVVRSVHPIPKVDGGHLYFAQY